MADQTNAEVSDERLREIVAGCEGVTPGPWKAIDKLHGRVAVISDNTGLVYGLTNDAPFPAVVAHIARLDPDTVKALATELLTRRSVTSQASEGEVAGWFWRWASSDEWRPLSRSGTEAGRADFVRDQEKIAPVVVAQLYLASVSKRVERLETAEPKTFDEWSEENGDVVWWCWRNGEWLGEAAWIGTPLDLGQTVEVELRSNQGEFVHRHQVGGWPGYHTHWTPHPTRPQALQGGRS